MALLIHKDPLGFEGRYTISDKFCNYCGRKLTVQQKFIGYDIETGIRDFYLKWKCQDSKWYNFHSSFRTDKNGDFEIEY